MDVCSRGFEKQEEIQIIGKSYGKNWLETNCEGGQKAFGIIKPC
jgi:hypothetical protein